MYSTKALLCLGVVHISQLSLLVCLVMILTEVNK